MGNVPKPSAGRDDRIVSYRLPFASDELPNFSNFSTSSLGLGAFRRDLADLRPRSATARRQRGITAISNRFL